MRRVVVATITGALGFLVFSSVYLARYQPLSVNGTGAAWVDPRFASELGDFAPPEGQYFSAYRVRYEDGRSFSYAMTLYNEGPLPVTITSIGEPECRGCTFPLVFERSSVAPAGGQYQYDREHATPFDGFVLEPGAFRYIVIEARFDHCESYSADTAVTYLSIPVGYRTAFVHHDARLPMPYSLEVPFHGPECPGGLQASA
jgi:hypothetical protein